MEWLTFEQVYDFALGIGVGFGIAAIWIFSVWQSMKEEAEEKNRSRRL